MKNEKEIKDVQEQIKLDLTRATDPQMIAGLQGQFAALDWVITLDKKEDQEEVNEE